METQSTEKRTIFEAIKSNLKIILSTIFLLIILISIYSWFAYKKDIKKTELSQNFINAKILLSEGKSSEALTILKRNIEGSDSTYSTLSLYLIIDQKLEKEKKEILNYFDKVLTIRSLKNEDLDLVKLKKAIFISSDANEEELLDLLNPIINSESAWRAQSIKFLADFYYSKKQYNKASQYYSILIESDSSNIDKKEIENRIKNFTK